MDFGYDQPEPFLCTAFAFYAVTQTNSTGSHFELSAFVENINCQKYTKHDLCIWIFLSQTTLVSTWMIDTLAAVHSLLSFGQTKRHCRPILCARVTEPLMFYTACCCYNSCAFDKAGN